MPSQFIPGQNSRHRIAAIALFRALVREARAISLPNDVLRKGIENPLPRLVKKGFKRNQTEASYRLVFAALTKGYKFLNLFKSAQTPDSKEHSEILTYLREKSLHDAKSEAGKPPPPTPRIQRPKPKWPPLFERVSHPGQPPVYISKRHPIPREDLSGTRHIPNIAVTAHGVVFLRQGKPQHRAVCDYVQKKNKYKIKQMNHLLGSMREEQQFAKEEDNWDRHLNSEIRSQQWAVKRAIELRQKREMPLSDLPDWVEVPVAQGPKEPEPWVYEESFRHSVAATFADASRRLNEDAADQSARARVFLQIREAERKALRGDHEYYRKKGHLWMIDTPYKKKQRRVAKRKKGGEDRHDRRAVRQDKARKSNWGGLSPTPIQV
ncbi:hypothetical protein CORC01_13369 [Colletotrichum orchidophilum]|uniref:DNA repair protein n=1 Tax=Colletotrichum orchidophilum TaxID=1209926 RepID=A0A1G4AQ94_9PEZI|nr:uncharacterized protein CORC01_13369 [Colletotrichum orchidophilum]OHE91340.1 hypothetical protein CORC01_13369 [Colletotrichum orchidophilum]